MTKKMLITPNSSLQIKRIKELPKEDIDAFNALLDEGTTWDFEQGLKFLSNDDNAIFVAYWEGGPVGFLSAHRLQRFDKRKAEVLLYELGVSENFRRRGIATALITEVKNWAKQVDADEVWVLTNQSNLAGMTTYESSGGVTESDDEQMFTYKIS